MYAKSVPVAVKVSAFSFESSPLVVQREEIVEIAADFLRRQHGRVQFETVARLEFVRQDRQLHLAGDFQLLLQCDELGLCAQRFAQLLDQPIQLLVLLADAADQVLEA